MALPRLIAKLEDVAEAHREHYTEVEGGDGFMLDTDEGSYKKKLDEFRVNNRKLLAEKKKLEGDAARFKDIDPEKHEEALAALATLEKLQETDLLAAGSVDQLVAKRTETMRKDHDRVVATKDKALKDATDQAGSYRGRLEELEIDQTITASVNKAGTVRKGAHDDVKARARHDWVIDDDGHPVAKRNGEPLFGKDTNPLTPDEWAQNLLTNAPHLFEPAKGAGADGGKHKSGTPAETVIAKGDPTAFGKNLEGIAEGKVAVR